MKIPLTPTFRRFVKEQVKSGRYVDESEVVRAALRLMEAEALGVGYREQGPGAGGDIMALVSLVMMQASESAQEDLKAMMAEVQAINAAKRSVRQLIDKVNRLVRQRAPKTSSAVRSTA